MVKFLLDAGADQEHKTDEMHTALMEAAMDGHVDVAKLLLEHGAQVNMPADSFESPLTLAACGGHVELANLLIERGANLEEVNDEGYTPLMEAAREGHEEMVALLLAHGAEINAQTEETQETALTLACCGGFLEVVDLLVKTLANIELGCSKPLMEASQEGHIEVVKYLIRAGANVNAQTQTGDTALTYACENGHTDVASILLDAGAELEHKSEGGRTPLMKAARAGHLQTVQFLLSKGANPNQQTVNNDHTVLSLAAAGGHTAILEQLLRAGANPLHKLKDDSTVIIEAAKGGHTAVVSLLLDWHPSGSDTSVIGTSHPLAGKQAATSQPASQVQSPLRPVAVPPAMPVPPVPPSTPTGNHKSSDNIIQSSCVSSTTQQPKLSVKTASADSTTSPHPKTRQDDVKSSLHKAELLAKAAQNKKPQLLEELCRFEQSINKNAKISKSQLSNQQLSQIMSDEEKARLQKSRRQASNVSSSSEQVQQPNQQKVKPVSSQESTRFEGVKNSDAVINPTNPPLLPWQIRAPEGQWPVASSSGSPAQMLQPILDEKGALRLMQVPGANKMSCEDIDLSQVIPKFDDEEQLRQLQQQLAQLQLQQQFYQPSGVLTSRLSPTAKLSTLDMVDSTYLDRKQFTSSALLSSVSKPNPLATPPVASSPIVTSKSVPSRTSTPDTVKGPEMPRPQPVGNVDTITPPPLPSSPNRSVQQDSHKTSQSSKPPIVQQTKKACRDLSSLSTEMLDLPMQQKLQQLLRQPQPPLELLQQLLLKKEQPELLQQLLQQPQLQQAQKQLKAAVAAGSGTTAGSKKAKKSTPSANLSHPSVSQSASNSSGASVKGEGGNCVHHHHHQHASCGHETAVCANAHCRHAPQPSSTVTSTTDQTAVPPPPPLYLTIDIDAQTESNHDTALTLACAGGHSDLVRLLLQRNAQLEHRDKKGFTPLILAATAGHLEVVQILVEHNADIEAQSERTKDTALSLACSGGRYEVVEYLLSCGANKEHRNISDYTPLSLAASGGYVNIIKLLLNAGAEINSRTGSKLGISPLMLAAMNGHTAAVKLLLDMGSDVNAMIETNRNTALTLACFQGRYEVVSLLVDRKANIEHRAKTGLTPLMEAASGGFVEVGRVLLDKGADVNAPPVPSSRDTALTIAADKGHHPFVELLIKRGAALDVKNKKGNSPLWLACNGGHLDVVQALVNAGADVDSQDNRRVSCLMASFRKGHVKVVKWLVRRITQFPSDQECQRFIATVTDPELKKKCQQCMEIILSAKARQAAEANKYATILLEEIDAERTREESKKAAQARKREKKKAKKRERLEKEKLDKDGKGDDEKVDDDDDDDDEIKQESLDRIVDSTDEKQSAKENGSDQTQSRLSAAYSAEYVEAFLTEMNHCLMQHSLPVDEKSGDSETQVEGGQTNKRNRTKRKNRTRPKNRDSSSRDDVTRDVGHNIVVPVDTKDSQKHVQSLITSSIETTNVRSMPVISTSSNSNMSKVVASSSNTDSKPKSSLPVNVVDTKLPSNRPTNTINVETNGRQGIGDLDDFGFLSNSGRVKPSPVKTETSKPISDKNSRLNIPEKPVTQSVSPMKGGPGSAKQANTPTPKKGSRKEEDWKEVVRKSRRMTLPSNVAGRIIGRNGSHLHAIRHYTGAHLEVDKIRGSNDRLVTIKGTPEAIKHAADIVTALISKPDKEVEQLLIKMKNKLASSSNPADLAVLDLEGKTLGRVTAPQATEKISIVSSAPVPVTTYPSMNSKTYQPLVNSTNFSIGVWEMPNFTNSNGVNTTVKSVADTKTTGSCARQLFPSAELITTSLPITSISRTTPTYTSSSVSKTKVVTALSTAPNVFADSSSINIRPLSLSQSQPASSLSLVSPLRPDQPLPIKPSVGVNAAENRPGTFSTASHGVFCTEYSPFSGGLVTDVLVGKKEDVADGRMNFASVAAAGVVGKNQSPTAQIGTVTIGQDCSNDTDSLEDLKAKAPGYKPVGLNQRPLPSPQTGDNKQMKGKLNNVFYSQSQVSPNLAAINIAMPDERFLDEHHQIDLHHGPLTPGEYYEKTMTSVEDRNTMSSSSSTPASSQSPRSSNDINKRKDEYASPHQPMTLPKVESRLNPEAPDFTLPVSRHNPIAFPPNFPPFLLNQGYPVIPDNLTSIPPPDLNMFGQSVGPIASQMSFGRLPTPFATYNMQSSVRPGMGRPPSREGSPVLGLSVADNNLISVGPPGFVPQAQTSGFMHGQSSAFIPQGQSPERNQLHQQQMPRPIGTGRRNVGSQNNYVDRPPQAPWSTGTDNSVDLMPQVMFQPSMMAELGAAGDINLGNNMFTNPAMISAASYGIEPLSDLSNDDQKIFGQPNRRMAMFVNGGSNAAFSAPGLSIERYDLPASNQPWSSGKEFTTSGDIRLGNWNWSTPPTI